MLNPSDPTYQQPLGDGLTLRTAACPQDVERVAVFNGLIHGPEVAVMTRNLLFRHSNLRGPDLIFVDDEQGQVVSSIMLIPWTWQYEDVLLPSAEMGVVGTLETHRRRGLIRHQVDYFKCRLCEQGFLLSHIQGIPYYYRQFGYEYALPLEGGWRIDTDQIPAYSGKPFTFRLACPSDIPAMASMFDQAVSDLSIHTVRDEAVWGYLMAELEGPDAMQHEAWIIEDEHGQVAGYMRLPAFHFGEQLVVDEASRLSFDACMAALNHVKTLTLQRQNPGIRLNLPASSALVRVARSLGALDLGTYSWQIHVPDIYKLLTALAPVFERRIAGSIFAGLTEDLRLSLWKETLSFHFVDGRLEGIESLGFTGQETITLSENQMIPLLLGHRTLDEQRAAFPDIVVWREYRLLFETLFPKAPSFIYTIY